MVDHFIVFRRIVCGLTLVIALSACGDEDTASECPPDALGEATTDCIDETTCDAGQALAEVCTRCGDAGGCEIEAMRCLPTCPTDGCGDGLECREGVCQRTVLCD